MVQVLKYQTMFVMADCGEKEGGQRMEKVLVAIKAYPDGSFDMRPGLNRRDKDGNLLDDPYEFEDDNGERSPAASTCKQQPSFRMLRRLRARARAHVCVDA